MGTIKQNQDLETTWMINTSNDTYILDENASITTSGDHAIEAVSGSNNDRLILKGDVKASETTAVVALNGNGHYVEVGAKSRIDGTDANVGVMSYGSDFTLNNAGRIDATFYGVATGDFATINNSGKIFSAQNGIGADDGLKLTNSGRIEADVHGVLAHSEGTVIKNLEGGEIVSDSLGISLTGNGDALIKNFGLISGNTAIMDKEGDAVVINKGTIEGFVNLGAGDDVFNTRGGTFLGQVNGGDGDDTYIIGKSGTNIVEQPGFGYDKVLSTASYTLGNHLEDLTLQGSKDIDGTGNAANNVLTGNDGDNVLMGMDGKDYLKGGKGNDFLFGGADQDMFDFKKGGGDDVVEDFVNGEDLIFATFANDGPEIADLLANHAVEKNGGVLITHGDDSLFIKNISLNQLDESDFFQGL